MSNLIVTEIKKFICGDFMFLKVYTNEGLTGIAESTIYDIGILEAQINYAKDIIVGENPANIGRIRRKGLLHRQCGSESIFDVLESALWDIKAKKMGVPLYQLLGTGPLRDNIRIYAHLKGACNSFPDEQTDNLFWEPWLGVDYTPEDLGKNALELVEEGYTAIKFDPFFPGENEPFYDYRPNEIFNAVERVEAIRTAVGDKIDLLIESRSKFNAATAIRIGKLLEKYNLLWIECPVLRGHSLKKFAYHVSIPVAMDGMAFRSKIDIKEYLENGSMDIYMPEYTHNGGISEVMKISAMCEAYGVKISPHNARGPVRAMVNAHLSAVFPNFLIMEHEQMLPWAVKPRIEIEKGHIKLPNIDTPGLGIDLDEEEIARHQERVEDGTYKGYELFKDPNWFKFFSGKTY